MGASVMPVPTGQPSPQDIARVQANVAKMRAQNAPESDVLAYLQHEDSLSHAPAAVASDPTDLSLRNIGRSLTQGATFGFGDELGLVNRDADKAFATAHPVANFLGRMVGGVAAPALAVAAAPEALAGVGGAALLGGAQGLLSGAGESEGGLADRAKGAAAGGLLGAAGGAATAGVAKGASAVARTIADRMHPERAVARGAAQLITPSVAAKLGEVDALAPGGGSIATATVPPEGLDQSRFLPMLRAIGASPKAASRAEADVMRQKAALDAARKGLGAQMDAVSGSLPVNAEARSVMAKVADVLGSKAPRVPAAGHLDAAGENPLGLEQSVGFSFDPESKTLDIQDARDALSRLRYAHRNAVKRGTEANGPNLHDITDAKNALQALIYQHHPEFEQLDRPYATVMNHLGHADDVLEAVQRSRANYTANKAYGATAGSLGGSLPRGSHGVVMEALDKILTNKAGAADAVARLIAKPGGPALVDQILRAVPPSSAGASRLATPIASAAIPAMRGLLFPTQP